MPGTDIAKRFYPGKLEKLLRKAYFFSKPLTPRRVQLFIRGSYIHIKRPFYRTIWPIDEKATSAPSGWTGWPDGKQFSLVLTHDVETEKGQDRCIHLAEMEKSLGFKSSFNFIAKQYTVSSESQDYLRSRGFEVGLHGLTHNGNLFRSKDYFQTQAVEINRYLKEWRAVGFRCPSMYHNLEWISDLNIEYDCSTFDTDPFEPQPDGMGTIFPFLVPRNSSPCSLPLAPLSSNDPLSSHEPSPPTSNLEPYTASANG